jgi:hypothetical protein
MKLAVASDERTHIDMNPIRGAPDGQGKEKRARDPYLALSQRRRKLEKAYTLSVTTARTTSVCVILPSLLPNFCKEYNMNDAAAHWTDEQFSDCTGG